MSGWSSSVLSDKEARLMRNRSLTKEEVAAFWRQHGSIPNAGSPRAVPVQYCCTRSDDDGFFLPENAADSSSAAANGGSWWTRSSWAFLNEPPPPPTTTREEVVLGSRAPRSFVVVACDQQLHAAARIVTGNCELVHSADY